MFGNLTDIAPKELAFSLVAYAALSYFVTGPEIAARVAKADFLPSCEANISAEIRRAAEAEINALPTPQESTAHQNGADAYLRMMRNYEGYQALDILTGGSFSMAEAELARQRRAARETYDRARSELQSRAQARIDAAPDMCGCMARSSYEENRTEWAIFTGALGLVVPEPVKAYGDEMRRHGAACLSQGDV